MNKIVKMLISIVVLYTHLKANNIAFPQPTGIFSVGKKDFECIDRNRLEKYNESAYFRTLSVSLWYPTIQACDSSVLDYDHDAQAYFRQKLAMIKLNEEEQQKIVSSIKIKAQHNAPLSSTDQQYPLIILSPGFGFPKGSYSGMAQELASHGYIVAVVSHPYFALQVTFKDGSVAAQNQVPYDTHEQWADSQETLKQDIIVVVDAITVLNESDELFQGRIDLDRIGIMGHSFGGSTAAHMLQADDRFMAGINMDGPLFNNKKLGVNTKPFMSILGQEMWNLLVSPERYYFGNLLGLSASLIDIIFDGYLYFLPKFHYESNTETYLVLLDKVNHCAFSDLAFLKTIPIVYNSGQDFLTGSLDGHKTSILTHSLLIQFFDTYLKKKVCNLSEKLSLMSGVSVHYHS